MAELNCKLSALCFSELYRLLGEELVHGELLDRLQQLGFDEDWLTEAADAYDAKWVQDAQYIVNGSADELALEVEHSVLATWLLAGLRNIGNSYDFSTSLRTAVLDRMTTEAPYISGSRPSSFSPIIRGWTLGMVIGNLDPELPVVPACYPINLHITAAYRGLVEQVDHLGGVNEPWPELAGTALYVRTGGLAEALRPPPPPRGLGHSLELLMAETKSQVPLAISERLRQNWIRWVERRNVLTHVVPDGNTSDSFTESAAQVQAWDQIKLTVLGITQFVCQQVSFELVQEQIPSALRGDPWDYLRRQIQTEW